MDDKLEDQLRQQVAELTAQVEKLKAEITLWQDDVSVYCPRCMARARK